MSARIWRTPP